MIAEKISNANKETLERILSAQPTLTRVGIAGDEIPGMTKKTILHAGPPVSWERMSGPQKGAVIGGLIYERLASNEDEARILAASGEITFDSCHHHNTVGPMAGIVTYSMPVWVVENKTYRNYAYCTFNEGLGKVLRMGAFSQEVINRLDWMEKILAPVIKEALEITGEINLKTLIAQVLQMGDEGHNRNKSGTSLLIRQLAPAIVRTKFSDEEKIEVLNFLNSNDHTFLNLTMPACKCTMDPAGGIKYSTIVYIMARNGTDFGIKVSGLGDRWFTAPAEIVSGLYFPGFTKEDANPDIGDSCITETTGIGGFAMACAIPIVQFVGGAPQDAINYSRQMYEITEGENNVYKIPVLDFRGTATGIDIQKVIESGIRPIINTGIAHKNPGVGQVGAGLVSPPIKCFEDALEAFVEILEQEGVL
jgi:hypothetical protein